jgi:hypothetical protein
MKNFTQESELIARLQKLEKSQARYRAAFLATAALAAALCLTGARRKTEDVLQAKSFQVVNDDSKVLAEFSSKNGFGQLVTYRADGSPVVSLTHSDDNCGRIEVQNAEGKTSVSLATSTTGSGNILVNSKSGAPAVQIGTSAAKNGGIWIFNADGNIVATITALSATSDGLAEIFDASGKKSLGHLP